MFNPLKNHHFGRQNYPPMNHLEERLDQAHAQTPYTPSVPFWGLFAQHTPRHDIGCLTPCKIIILRDKMIPKLFIFSPLTPPPYLGTLGGGGGTLCFVGFEPWSAKRLRDKPSRGRLSGMRFKPTLGQLAANCLSSPPLFLPAQVRFIIT